jgi:hypothetical protein
MLQSLCLRQSWGGVFVWLKITDAMVDVVDNKPGFAEVEDSFDSRFGAQLEIWKGADEEKAKEAARELVSLVEKATFKGNDTLLTVTREAVDKWPNNRATVEGQEGIVEKDHGWVFTIPAGGYISTRQDLTLGSQDGQIVVKGGRGDQFAWFSGGDVVSLTCHRSEEADDLPVLGFRGEHWAVGGHKLHNDQR